MQKQRLQNQPFKTNNKKQSNALQSIPETNISARNSLPPHSKLIRKQKIINYNTVQDESSQKLNELYLYLTHTPKCHKTEQTHPHQKLPEQEIKSFNIEEDSFSNKHITIKKEYQPSHNPNVKETFTLDKNQVVLEPKKHHNKTQPEENNKNKELQRKQQLPASGNGLIILEKGWKYKGQYAAGLFHGFGELYQNQNLVYSGHFQFGYFHGHGKLRHHTAFNYLVKPNPLSNIQNQLEPLQQSFPSAQWTAYFGQFRQGNITGYGQLWLATGQKISSKWHKGSRISKTYIIKEIDSNAE